MASPAQSFVYALRAVYEGKNDMAALSGDLKSIGKIESFQKLQVGFAATTSSLNDAKAQLRSLKADMNQPGGTAFTAAYEKAVGDVQKLTRSLQQQKGKLDESRTALQGQGVAVGDLAGELQRLDSSVQGQGKTLAAYRTIGIQSFSAIEAEIKGLHGAYADLEASGEHSAAELAKAWETVEQKTTSLNRQMAVLKPPSQQFVDMARLGVRSFAEVEKEIEEVRQAYKRLEVAGLSAQESIVFKERMKDKIRELKQETNGWAKALGRAQDHWLGLAGLVGGGAGTGRAIAEYATFDDAMLKVKAVSGATTEELELMRKKAEELGRTTRYTGTEAAQGMAELASTGMKAREVIETLPSAMNMTAIAGGEVKESADLLTDIMSQFNLEVEDSGRVADVLVGGYTGASTSLEELGVAMKYVGPMTANLGYSLEDTTAILQALAEGGYKGEKAGTALRGGLAQLIKPSSEAAAVLEKYQVQVYNSSGSVRDFADIVGDLGKASMTPAELLAVFGREAGPGMMALLGQGADAIRQYRTELGNVNGLAAKVASEMASGIGGKLDKMKASFSAAGNAMVSLYGPALMLIIDLVAAGANGIARLAGAVTDANPVIRMLVGGLGLGASAFAVWHLGLKHVVAALSLARAHLIPLNVNLAISNLSLKSLPAKLIASAQGFRTLAGSATLAGKALRGLGAIGLVVMAYEIGHAVGEWALKFDWVKRVGISLASGLHLLGLRMRWLWNIISLDKSEADAISSQIETVQKAYSEMFAEVGKQQSQVEGAKSGQAAVTNEVAKGAEAQVAISVEAAKKMEAAYASVTPSAALATGADVKNDQGSKVDAFGRTEQEGKDLALQMRIAAAKKSGDMTGFKKVEKDNGTWEWGVDEKAGVSQKNDPKKVYGKNGKWNYAYGEQKNLKDIGAGYYERIAGNVRSNISGLGDLSKIGKTTEGTQPTETKKVHELKLGKATLNGTESDINSFLDELKRAGALA